MTEVNNKTSYKPKINWKAGVIIFDLVKPIYGSFFGIWDKWLNLAEKNNLKLVVNTPFGTSTYQSAKEYLENTERLERYYKNPNEPMIFYARHFAPDIAKREKRKRLEKKEQKIIEDFSIPLEIMLKLKKIWEEKYGKEKYHKTGDRKNI